MSKPLLLLLATLAMFGLLLAIAGYIFSRKHRDRIETPKYRMMDDD